jgi:hypothetical protein
MGSIAKKFVSPVMTLVQLMSLGYLALPLSVAAQSSPEAMILERELKRAGRDQDEAKLRGRMATKFDTLLVEAKAQREIMEKWRKTHPKRPDWESLNR